MENQSCACPELPAGSKRFWCERHKCWKTSHWRTLCQTRADYRQLWDHGQGPGQQSAGGSGQPSTPRALPTYLSCPHRGEKIASLPSRLYNLGCGEVPFYRCHYFDEAVFFGCSESTLLRVLDKIRQAVPTFAGRVCRRCQIFANLQ